VLKQPQLFSSTLHKTFDECLVGSDPPEHTLVRSLLQPLFSQRVLTGLGDFTIACSNKLLDDVKGKGEFNFVNEFSLPLAQAVVAKFLGLTDAEAQSLKNCISNHVYAMEYLDNMQQFFHRYLEISRKATGDGAAALLLQGVEEEKLSFDGAVKLMRLLWVAGMTTTSMLLTKAAHEVLKDEELAGMLRDNDQLLPKFIDECLRLEAPETELRRITTTEIQLGNKTIPPGSVLLLSLRAANRDSNYFENPDSVLLDRPAKRHLSFGGGYHYCLGAGIAKMEAKYALKAVLSRLPQLKLSAGKQVVYFPSPHFRGISELIVSA
jgi:cytochrome P450